MLSPIGISNHPWIAAYWQESWPWQASGSQKHSALPTQVHFGCPRNKENTALPLLVAAKSGSHLALPWIHVKPNAGVKDSESCWRNNKMSCTRMMGPKNSQQWRQATMLTLKCWERRHTTVWKIIDYGCWKLVAHWMSGETLAALPK
jgi:hypothetical protein